MLCHGRGVVGLGSTPGQLLDLFWNAMMSRIAVLFTALSRNV